jgi:hypothetical protein
MMSEIYLYKVDVIFMDKEIGRYPTVDSSPEVIDNILVFYICGHKISIPLINVRLWECAEYIKKD